MEQDDAAKLNEEAEEQAYNGTSTGGSINSQSAPHFAAIIDQHEQNILPEGHVTQVEVRTQAYAQEPLGSMHETEREIIRSYIDERYEAYP